MRKPKASTRRTAKAPPSRAGCFADELTRMVYARGTQAEFAKACGWNQGIVSGYMSGRRTPKRKQLGIILEVAGRHMAAPLFHAYTLDRLPDGFDYARPTCHKLARRKPPPQAASDQTNTLRRIAAMIAEALDHKRHPSHA